MLDRWTDIGHINLIGGLGTSNPSEKSLNNNAQFTFYFYNFQQIQSAHPFISIFNKQISLKKISFDRKCIYLSVSSAICKFLV